METEKYFETKQPSLLMSLFLIETNYKNISNWSGIFNNLIEKYEFMATFLFYCQT